MNSQEVIYNPEVPPRSSDVSKVCLEFAESSTLFLLFYFCLEIEFRTTLKLTSFLKPLRTWNSVTIASMAFLYLSPRKEKVGRSNKTETLAPPAWPNFGLTLFEVIQDDFFRYRKFPKTISWLYRFLQVALKFFLLKSDHPLRVLISFLLKILEH